MPLRLASKEDILQAVEEEQFDYFDNEDYISGKPVSSSYKTDEDYDAYWNRRETNTLTPEEQADEETKDSAKVVEDHNDGDGRTMYKTIHFKPYDLYVTILGTYSSHGSSWWNDVFLSRPKEVTVVVYNRISDDEQTS
jgi:FtsZ-interacting cell division protein YlmF